MKETVDFARSVGARHGFLIHEGLLNERGWQLSFDRHQEMVSTTFHDLRDGQPWRCRKADPGAGDQSMRSVPNLVVQAGSTWTTGGSV